MTLVYQTFRNVHFTTLINAQGVPEYCLSAYDDARKIIGAVRARRGDGFSQDRSFMPPRTSIPETCVYGGVLWNHYGHFLLESLSRVWAAGGEFRAAPIVWHTFPEVTGLEPWQEHIFHVLGIHPSRHIFLTEPTYVKEVVVPDQGFVMWKWFHPELARFLGVYQFADPPCERNVWLSRGMLPNYLSKAENEHEIEERLAQEGWDILHPETCGVGEVLHRLSRAPAIAGVLGSAFHTLILGRDVRAKITILGRPPEDFGNYNLIATAKNFQQTSLVSSYTVIGKTGPYGTHLRYNSVDDLVLSLCN